MPESGLCGQVLEESGPWQQVLPETGLPGQMLQPPEFSLRGQVLLGPGLGQDVLSELGLGGALEGSSKCEPAVASPSRVTV